MPRYKAKRDIAGFTEKQYKHVTKSELDKLGNDDLKRAIKSAVKTANSRIRRSQGLSSPSGYGVGASGYFQAGTKGLNREQMETLYKSVRGYLAQGETRTGLGISKSRVKKYDYLTQKDIAGKPKNELYEQALTEARAANRRLNLLYKSGLADSPVITDKYINISNKDFGTEEGFFRLPSENMSKSDIEYLLLNIRGFLAKGYTPAEVKKRVKKFGENFGVSDVRIAEYMLNMKKQMDNEGFAKDFIYESLNDNSLVRLYDSGLDDESVMQILSDSEKQWKLERQRLKDGFNRKNSKRRFKSR